MEIRCGGCGTYRNSIVHIKVGSIVIIANFKRLEYTHGNVGGPSA